MSCTVVAVSYALSGVIHAFVIGTSILTTAVSVVSVKMAENEIKQKYIGDELQESVMPKDCDDVKIISDINFMEKSFETPFMDKEILLKTLTEHGAQNIVEEYGKIKGDVENYSLVFEKMEQDKPYFLRITYLEEDNPNLKFNDLQNEYVLNVQEETYLNIIDRLKENNMEIEDEEVLEDNTIVLTINLGQ